MRQSFDTLPRFEDRPTPYGLKVQVGDRRLHEHRIVAEKALGRPLPEGVQVHHVDEDTTNNANRNLVICQDISYHWLLHRRTKTVRAGGNPNTERACCTCDKPRPFADFYTSTSECKFCARARALVNLRRRQEAAHGA